MMESIIRFFLLIVLVQIGHVHAQHVEIGIRGNFYFPLEGNYLNRLGGTLALEFPVVNNYSISARGGGGKGGNIYKRQDVAYTGMIGVLRKIYMKNDYSLYTGAEFGFAYREMSDNESLYLGNIKQNLFPVNLVVGLRKSIGSSISVQILMQPGYEYIVSQMGAGLEYWNFRNSFFVSSEIGLIYTLPSN
jgi:hypothetical protein